MGLGHVARQALLRAGLQTRMLSREFGDRSGIELRWRKDRDSTLRGAISSFVDEGIEYMFFVANDADTVQAEALSGRLYEREGLRLIQKHFRGGTYVDIGTNVGNHAIFVAKALCADRVICFEPNPEALRILEINMRLNRCTKDLVVHRVGLSDTPGRGTLSGYRNNLGSARLTIATGTDGFPIAVGDEVLIDEKVDFIKIDTEGFELGVMRGLERTIRRDQPVLFVEVDEKNLSEFHELLKQLSYSVVDQLRNYDDNQNIVAKAKT